MPLRNQTHPLLETHKRKTQTIAGPLCSLLSILIAHPSTICTIAVLKRKFSCDFCQSVWALFSLLWTKGQKPGNIPPWPWLTPDVRASQDNERQSFFSPLTAKSPIITFFSFHPDVCSWRPAELVSVVREPLIYSLTAMPASRIAEVTQVRLWMPGLSSLGESGPMQMAASPGTKMMARRKEKQVPLPSTNKVKSLAISLLLPVVLSL